MHAADRLRQRGVQPFHQRPGREDEVDAGRFEIGRQIGMEQPCGLAELAHVAEHGDAAAAGTWPGLGQHLEGGAHGGRAGVVAVVDHHDARDAAIFTRWPRP
jgi:hypothetical protein